VNAFRSFLLRSIVWLGGLRIARLIANVFKINRDKNGQLGFPFVRRRHSNSAQILLYHRVNDENDAFFPGIPSKTFAQQMAYVAEHYMVCSLGETVERLRSDDVPADLLTITFDDGYRDNYTHAFPILNELGLPATIFLATDAIGTGRMLWHDRVFSAFRTTRVKSLEQFGKNRKIYSLDTASDKRRTLNDVLKFLWSTDDTDRALWVEKLVRQLAIEESTDCDGLMLNWDDVRTMSEHRISFGAHTVTHPILSRLPVAQVRREIRGSRDAIEANLKKPVRFFAYPVGRREDFTAAVKHELLDAGFECGVTTVFGSNDSKQDLFELCRATPWDKNIEAFALRLNYFKFAF